MNPASAPGTNASPDLTAILKSLSSYTPQNFQLEQNANLPFPSSAQESGRRSNSLNPSPYSRQSDNPTLEKGQTPHTIQTEHGTTHTTTTLPSTKSIKTYPAALQYITTHLLPRPYFLSQIKQMLRTQHEHETTWHVNRQALERQIAGRGESKRRLDAVLACVTASRASAVAAPLPEGKSVYTVEPADTTKELQRYDRKVYAAQQEMVRSMERQLGQLGVPLFGPDLTINRVGSEDDKDVQAVRLRICAFLEDMCTE